MVAPLVPSAPSATTRIAIRAVRSVLPTLLFFFILVVVAAVARHGKLRHIVGEPCEDFRQVVRIDQVFFYDRFRRLDLTRSLPRVPLRGGVG
jgi:hypothetical protein